MDPELTTDPGAVRAPRAPAAPHLPARSSWDAVADAWRARVGPAGPPANPITRRMLALADLSRCERVVDLGCGAGDPALAIAGALGGRGHVVGLDTSAAMVAAARALAVERGLGNVAFEVIASERELGVEPSSFDAATCRDGLSYMADPVAALRSLHAALAGGGRAVAGCWGPPERAPALSIPLEIAGRHVRLPEPAATGPGPFAIASEEALRSAFEDAGLREIETTVFDAPVVRAASAVECWRLVTATDPAIAAALAPLAPAARAAVDADAERSLDETFGAGSIELRAEHLLAIGRR